MRQDRLAELINLLDLAMIPEVGETAVDDFALILPSSFLRLRVMFVETEWHAHGQTYMSLFAANKKRTSPRLWQLIFVMGPTLQRKPS
jgi:hypothetical protein